MSGETHSRATSIHQCFNLIYVYLYHTGCLGCKIKNGKELYCKKWYRLYSYIYRSIYLTGLIGGFLYKIYDEELNEAMMGILTPVVKVILTFECFICPISYVEVTFYMDWYCDKYLKLANTLQSLDEQLKMNFPSIQWNYHKSTRKYNPMTVGIYGFYSIVSTIYIFHIAHCRCGWFSSTILSLCYACVTGAPAFAGFLFIGNMDMLRLRFRLIRKLLQLQFVNKHTKSRHMHAEDVAKFKFLIVTLNQVFCVVSGSGLFHDFAITTSLGYLLCSKALDTKAKWYEYVFVSLFMVPRIYKVLTTSIYGYTTQKERKNCSREFVKIESNFKKSTIIRQPLEDFLHWSMHNNYSIKVGKILNCNLSLIFLTLNSVVNYILIYIQLQFQQNSIVNRFMNNVELITNDAEVL
ncbi:putative gustatory receptor 47b [Lucilia cuprina]|uniref:Putative gustatory receptor 47b n=1 Tax=Lucilia cuprina TaxID=7375 RepID=A0A0L0C709_LUCCU|nr:putative gustatory receptor 47b [Lucilia cuprina]